MFKAVFRWFGHAAANGIVEGVAFVIAAALFLSVWSWAKGLTLTRAILLGLVIAVGLALILFLVSLAVAKFRGQVAQTSEHPNSGNENKQLEQMAESLRRGLEREAGLEASRQIAETNYITLQEQFKGEIEKEKARGKDLATQLQAAQTEIALSKQEVCSDDWLHTIAEYEKSAPDTRLVVFGCNIWNRRFSEEPREIEFSFDLINCSVYPLTLKEIASTARIVFANKPLLYPPTMQLSADAYLHGSKGWFHLTQQLTEGEYQRILKADQQCAFEFQKLGIGIKGGKDFEDSVSHATLRIPFLITLSNQIFPAKH